ncbi:hypothetical protein JCM10213_000423 [Rhodosporidiobolus nylandii]
MPASSSSTATAAAAAAKAAGTQQSIAPHAGVDAPKSSQMPDLIDFVANRPIHVQNCDSRNLTVDTKRASFVKDADRDNSNAIFVAMGRAAYVALKRTTNNWGNWSVLTTEPVKDVKYQQGFDTLKAKLEELVGPNGDVVLHARNDTDLRFSRRYDDFKGKSEVFPNVCDYTSGGVLEKAPALDDLSTISSNSLVAVGFTVKIYNKDAFENNGASPSPAGDEDDAAKKKATGGRRGRKEEVRVTYGARLEMFGVWYLGRDDVNSAEGSPTKIPKM